MTGRKKEKEKKLDIGMAGYERKRGKNKRHDQQKTRGEVKIIKKKIYIKKEKS